MIAACTLHNFIKMEMRSDRDFIRFQGEGSIVENNHGENNEDNDLFAPLQLGATQGWHANEMKLQMQSLHIIVH